MKLRTVLGRKTRSAGGQEAERNNTGTLHEEAEGTEIILEHGTRKQK